MKPSVKICGLTDLSSLLAAVSAGVGFVGFVHHPSSPRHLALDAGERLRGEVPDRVTVVALAVDPPDSVLEALLHLWRPGMIQLHGAETPDRVREVRLRFGVPVMKALSVSSPADLDRARGYADCVDWLLLDSASGGSGTPFDWTLLRDFRYEKPWMLAGGLTPETVGDAIARLSPDAVDVSSGVEERRGVKSPDKIRSFVDQVRAASSMFGR